MQYSIKKGINTLTINYGDSSFVDRVIYNPNLFEIIEKENKSIQKARLFESGEKRITNHHKKFSDSNRLNIQLGIRNKHLHYNHFPRYTTEEIDKTKNKKRKKGMQIINQLYAILEEAEKQ